ncbi:tRNA (adenosine(37)-N6)-dimethylallyltransferase MiaA [Salinimicrobium sp. MT39]|uniref:tRNA dimethylallyltransferase n=1 Tax=Salinimicrobium profundisediminis TaxID=2994553 RepID=A0A9X3CVW9_9FLAO|nr:tRNA (adenosine(37)-N6)-dimethylallyltransferase MiaA [Salinimicrobium profundisediminis]MCX2837640.1 tRNA (adenosine(37)-N6)-dimethylallyltransferase MiaA [Salinimicrobium profundisediminis]
MNKKYLIAVVGPTAIGKTALGIELARHFNTEIISADSRQFYKEMQIGTAVPSEAELKAAKHHFIQHISVENDYSVGDFERDALQRLQELFLKHDVVVMVGGSGLYIDAVVKGLDEFPEVDPQIRLNLKEELEQKGLETLQEELKTLDLEYYSEVDLQNPQRVIRALEICRGTGKPYSDFRKKSSKNRFFDTLYVGVSAEREIIYGRINRRVDIMMQHGLLEEVKGLKDKRERNALNTVGYKEVFKYLDAQWDLDTAVSEIKKNTRRFAKRQLTWFRKNEAINWFDAETPVKEIITAIQKKITL